ncbi:G-PROTEIN-RECEP-F1-2 domain-containing protein [Aphelenchoides bicaudatus]|nr:G-PROTEIN-RECEP-F1-2 domain-containing protein [Aphelenchoides bicaudatus]
MMLAVTLLISFVFIVLIIVALSGNVLVCAAVFLDRRLRRQPENLFLVSLAVSDLTVAVLVMSFSAVNDLLGYWPFGEAYCNFWICCDITSCTASILNLCAIAFDRYCHISRPMKYARYSSKRLICAAICVVWLLSSFIGAAQIIIGVANEEEQTVYGDDEDFSTYATDLIHRPTCHLRLSPSYAIFSSMMSFFLPATIMVLLYTKLYLYARQHVRSIRAQLKQATSLLMLASHHIRHVVAAHNVNYQECNGNGEMHNGTMSNGNNNHTPTRVPLAVEEDFQNNMEPTMFPDIETPRPAAVQQQHAGRSVSDQKARLTLGVIMGTFLLCWFPFFIINIWRSFYPDFFPPQVFQVVTWLGYLNSTVNPIIYGIFNRDFRRAFKRTLMKILYCYNDARKHSMFFGGNGYTQGEAHRNNSG